MKLCTFFKWKVGLWSASRSIYFNTWDNREGSHFVLSSQFNLEIMSSALC